MVDMSMINIAFEAPQQSARSGYERLTLSVAHPTQSVPDVGELDFLLSGSCCAISCCSAIDFQW